MSNSQSTLTRPEALPVIDAYIQLGEYAEEQHVDIAQVVAQAHTLFEKDEPYSELAPHNNDRWHQFLNFGVRVFEYTESSVDRNADVNAMLGWFITKHTISA